MKSTINQLKRILIDHDLNGGEVNAINRAIEILEQKPKTGHWKRVTDKTGHLVWECDCGWQQRFNTNYCPDCGAKME